jgi:alpha-tubulin suppressor-like RCC1 family protein
MQYGKAYAWRDGERPRPIEAVAREHIVQIAAGEDGHFALLAASGSVFTYGANLYGQLALGDNHSRTAAEAKRVAALPPIASVALGGRHSLFLGREDGRVFAAGADTHGQLGVSPPPWSSLVAARNRPELVQGLASTPVRQLACGRDFSLALSSDGELWSFGFGQYGQLADGNLRHMSTPARVQRPPFWRDYGAAVKALECGAGHCAALLENGELWGWGSSVSGQLGSGIVRGPQRFPALVQKPRQQTDRSTSSTTTATAGTTSSAAAPVPVIDRINCVPEGTIVFTRRT